MKRYATVAFALFAAYLVMSTAPVAASHGSLAVASEHSSESEFEEGSFTNAAVSDDSVQLYTGSEQIVSRYPLDSTPISDVEGSNAGSAVGSPSVVDGVDGDALNFGGDSHAEVPHDESLTFGPDEEFTVSFFVQFDDDRSSNEGLISKGDSNVDQNYQVFLDTHRFRGAATDSNGIQRTGMSSTVESDTWYFVALSRDASGELRLIVDGEEVGSTQLDGAYEGSGDLLIGDGRYFADELNGTIDEVRIYDDALSEGDIIVNRDTPGSLHADAGAYQSATHSVADAQEVWTDLSLSDATATVEWQGYDGSQWQVVDSATYSSTGNYTADVSEADYEEWRVNVSFEATGSNPSGQLHGEGVLVETDAPTVDDSSLTPNSTDTSTGESVSLSADISDADFGASYGDSVTVEWYVDGEQVGTSSTSSSGTVEHTVTNIDAGEHQWHVEVTDSFGHSTVSATAEFAAPAELRILDETSPEERVQGENTSVELQFYFDDGDGMVVERSTQDGTINMTGLPVDESFVVVANADGYRPRRIYVQSLLRTQQVYLLPDSATAVEPVFELQDYTGQYDSESTVLQLQRSLGGSWETVSGDFFGANGQYPVQLERNVRHRLVLINTNTGERRRVGTFTPLTSGQQLIEVQSSGEIDVTSPVVAEVSPSTRSLPALEGTTITTRLNPRGGSLDYWEATVTYRENGQETTLATTRETSGGSANLPVDLSDRANGSIEVVVTWRVDGETASKSVEYDIQKSYQNQYSLLNTISRIDTLVPAGNRADFKVFVALIVTVVLTTGTVQQLRASTEVAGLTAVGCIAGFAIIGWMDYNVLFASVVAFGGFAAVRRGL